MTPEEYAQYERARSRVRQRQLIEAKLDALEELFGGQPLQPQIRSALRERGFIFMPTRALPCYTAYVYDPIPPPFIRKGPPIPYRTDGPPLIVYLPAEMFDNLTDDDE